VISGAPATIMFPVGAFINIDLPSAAVIRNFRIVGDSHIRLPGIRALENQFGGGMSMRRPVHLVLDLTIEILGALRPSSGERQSVIV
jgi:hypothetical protein